MKSDRLNSEVVLSWEEFSQLRAAMREHLSKTALDKVEIFNKIDNFISLNVLLLFSGAKVMNYIVIFCTL